MVCSSFMLFANPVSQEYAQSIAVNFYRHNAPASISNYTVNNVILNQYEGITTWYVVTFQSGGFVMVAADDAVIPIIGYSYESSYANTDLPENISKWYNNYDKEIKYIIDSKLDNKETLKKWNAIANNEFTKSGNAVGQLCNTTWNQDCYYNASCPSASGGPCNHVYTGCVATALAQVMKKWNYPASGTGTHTYTDPTYGSQTANFGSTTYGWGSMPNNVSSANAAVATLMYHCGVGVNMTYGTSGSGAYTWDVPTALISYFNYQPTAEIVFKADFTAANWIALLKIELDASRPVLYSGDDGSEGHAFVCDGYDNSNNFHFNWGWSSMSDGYYAIGSLNPGGYTPNLDNAAVIRIRPLSSAPIANFGANTTTPAVGGTVTFTDYSTNSPTTWLWSFPGGNPATSTLQTPPAITYSTAGLYQVALTVSNGTDTDTKTRAGYINVGGTPSAWIKQNTGFTSVSRGIDQICIINPYIVWAKAYDGSGSNTNICEFTKTINGGSSWTPGTISFTGSTNYGVSNIFPLSDTVCYACMFPYPTTGTGGKIVKTTNGGTTWTIQATATFTGSWADFVHFFNGNDGVAVGDPSGTDFVIYTTTNGGTNWTQTSAANIPNCSSGEAGITNLYDAVGNTIWFGTTMGRIYKSVDKGLNWTVATTGLGTAAVVMPVFKDALNGIVTGTNNSTGAYIGMKKTTDGGTTWSTVTPTGFYVKNPHIDFIPGTASTWVDVAGGPGKGSSYSLNDCSSFLNIDTGSTQYESVTFYDINTGWAGGFNTSSTDGGIWKWANPISVGITNVNPVAENNIQIFPNPNAGSFTIQMNAEEMETINIRVTNIMGELVYEEKGLNVNGQFTKQINLDHINNGIYFVNMSGQKTNYSSKIIIQR